MMFFLIVVGAILPYPFSVLLFIAYTVYLLERVGPLLPLLAGMGIIFFISSFIEQSSMETVLSRIIHASLLVFPPFIYINRKHVEEIGKEMKKIGFPKDIILMVKVIFPYKTLAMKKIERIENARKMRAGKRIEGLIPFLHSLFRKAETLAYSMEIRGLRR